MTRNDKPCYVVRATSYKLQAATQWTAMRLLLDLGYTVDSPHWQDVHPSKGKHS